MRRKRVEKVSFADMPSELQRRDDECPEIKEARNQWLEQNGLSFFDYLGWIRDRHPLAKLRPPARPKLMTPEQLAELDARLEREGQKPL